MACVLRNCLSTSWRILGASPSSLLSKASLSSLGLASEVVIDRNEQYVALNYFSSPLVLSKGEGVHVWDMEGKRYLDFLSGFSALNQGHRHPRIIKAMKDQLDRITLTSRSYYNDALGEFAEYTTKLFGYDRLLPTNTGVEGAESAVKLARRWAYDVKGVPRNQATVVFARGCFWGRSIAAISASTDPESYEGFGPYVSNFVSIDFDNLSALEVCEYVQFACVVEGMVV